MPPPPLNLPHLLLSIIKIAAPNIGEVLSERKVSHGVLKRFCNKNRSKKIAMWRKPKRRTSRGSSGKNTSKQSFSQKKIEDEKKMNQSKSFLL